MLLFYFMYIFMFVSLSVVYSEAKDKFPHCLNTHKQEMEITL